MKWDLSEKQGQSDKNIGHIKKVCGGNVIKKRWCTFESPDLLEILLISTERSLPVCLWIDKGMTF